MKKYLFLLFGIMILCGCDGKSDDSNVVVRQCSEYNVEMSFSDEGESMHAVINGDAVDMTIAISASGARYVGVLNDTDVTLWGQGDNWIMFLNDEAPIECTAK